MKTNLKLFTILVLVFLFVFLFASCGKETYTVTYMVDDEVYDTQEVKEGKTISTIDGPEKTGYTFVEWEPVDFDLASSVTGNVTLVAKYQINSYTVTFKDGSTVVDTKSVEYGSTVTEATAPQKTGYHLASWKNGSADFNFESAITSDLTLTANYEINVYTIRFMSNGETFSSIQVTHGEKVTAPTENPTLKGHTFSKWVIGETDYDFDTTVTEAFDIEAAYTKNSYTVKFYAEYQKIAEQTVLYGSKLASVTPPEKVGYNFVGWLYGDSSFSLFNPVEDDMTLTAKYELKSYTVLFKNGTRTVLTKSIKHGSTVSAPNNIPTQTGYTFRAWQLNGVDFDFNTFITSDLTIVADFTINSYKVTFMVGDTKVGEKATDYNTTITTLEAPPREDASFRAWLLNGKDFDFSTPITSDITLEAEYVEKYEGTAINSVDGLKALANAEPGIYTIIKDLKLLADWTPINLPAGVVLEGHNHKITGLKTALFSTVNGTVQNLVLESPTIKVEKKTTEEDGVYGALAKVLKDGAIIDHVVVKDANIGALTVGGIAGSAEDKVSITNCTVSGTIYAASTATKSNVGGILGSYKRNAGDKTAEYDGLTMSGCTNNATITNANSSQSNVGGILGAASNTGAYKLIKLTFTSCVNNGNITVSATASIAGGICGNDFKAGYAYFTDCTNTGVIQASGDLGGIIGSANSSTSTNQIALVFTNCKNDGDLTSLTGSCGGILGCATTINQPASLNYSSNTATIKGVYAGGLIGYSNTKHNVNATNSANYGNVIATECAGSFIGKDNSTDANASPIRTIENCYFAGSISAPGKDAGLLVGYVIIGGSTTRYMAYIIENCYLESSVAGANVGMFGHLNAQIMVSDYGAASSSTVSSTFLGGFSNFKFYFENVYLAGSLTGTSHSAILFGLYESKTAPVFYTEEKLQTVGNVELSTTNLTVTGVESPVWYYQQNYDEGTACSYFAKNKTEASAGTKYTSTTIESKSLESSAPTNPAATGLNELAEANEWKSWTVEDGKPSLKFD